MWLLLPGRVQEREATLEQNSKKEVGVKKRNTVRDDCCQSQDISGSENNVCPETAW